MGPHSQDISLVADGVEGAGVSLQKIQCVLEKSSNEYANGFKYRKVEYLG